MNNEVILDGGRLIVREKFIELFRSNRLDSFESLMEHPGHGVAKCVLESRSTVCLNLADEKGDLPCFLKRHKCRGRRALGLIPGPPGALNEWNAMKWFEESGLPGPEPVAYGADGESSLVISAGVPHYSKLSEWVKENRPGDKATGARRRVAMELGRLVGRLHLMGFSHQDLYLCHFLCGNRETALPLTLIDLQRVRRKKRLPRSWQVKDLAQLYFSAKESVTHGEILRFWSAYIKEFSQKERGITLWPRIARKAKRIERHTIKNNL